jgi:hypothetical protein
MAPSSAECMEEERASSRVECKVTAQPQRNGRAGGGLHGGSGGGGGRTGVGRLDGYLHGGRGLPRPARRSIAPVVVVVAARRGAQRQGPAEPHAARAIGREPFRGICVVAEQNPSPPPRTRAPTSAHLHCIPTTPSLRAHWMPQHVGSRVVRQAEAAAAAAAYRFAAASGRDEFDDLLLPPAAALLRTSSLLSPPCPAEPSLASRRQRTHPSKEDVWKSRRCGVQRPSAPSRTPAVCEQHLAIVMEALARPSGLLPLLLDALRALQTASHQLKADKQGLRRTNTSYR